MITRSDKLTFITINPLSGRADVSITETFTDDVDGTTVATARGLTDAEAVAAYGSGATATFLAAALAYVNAIKAPSAPAVTLP